MNITLILIGLLSVAAGWKVKTKKDAGWFGFGYVALVVYIISFFAMTFGSVLFSKAVDIARLLSNGGELNALNFSNEMIIMGIGIFIFAIVIFFAFIGILMYVFGVKMDIFFKVIRNFGVYFFIPFLMIGFEILLIYSLIHGNDVPRFATAILIFFIVVLGLGIVGYINMIFFSKAKLKWEKTGTASWGANWVTEEEEQGAIEETRQAKERKNKNMVPLNEKYLRKPDDYRKE